MPQATTYPESVRLPNYTQNPRTILAAEWLPDQPQFNNPGMTVARNVYPLSANAYGPIRNLVSMGVPGLPGQMCGMYSCFDGLGHQHVVAGTGSKLYQLSSEFGTFATVTNHAITFQASVDNPWSMTLYGNSVIATNGVDPIQAYAFDLDPDFQVLSTAAPLAKYCATVRDFVMVANVTLTSGTRLPARVQWPAIGDPSNWPNVLSSDPATLQIAAELQSDYQDLRSAYGHVRGIQGGLQSADAGIFMDGAVYAVQYVGSPDIFSFQVVPGAVGCWLPETITSIGGIAYYLGADYQFYAFNGLSPTAISAQKVSRWFFNDPIDGVDRNYLNRIQAATDPTTQSVIWLYCGPDSGGTPNRMLIWNYQIQRWTMARVTAQWITRGISAGLRSDQPPSSPILYVIDEQNQLATFAGPNLEAVLETAEEQPLPGMRARLTSVRPQIDGGSGAGETNFYGSGHFGGGIYSIGDDTTPPPDSTIQVGSRNRLQDSVVYGDPVTRNIWGTCSVRVDARYMRGRITIPQNAAWSYCLGMEIDFGKSTNR